MKKLTSIQIFNICFLVFMLIADACYLFIPASEYITKTIPSVGFVLGGVVNLLYVLKNKGNFMSHTGYKWWMLVGLIFACLGDIFLIDFFTLGVIFFALGHIFFFVSFCHIEKFRLIDLAYSGALAAICAAIIFFYDGFVFDGMMPLILVYAIIISFMVGKTISNYFYNKSKFNLIVAIGSIMFFLSDFFLLFRLFAGWGRIGSILCLIFYYPAEFVLAYSIIPVSKSNKGEN